MRNKGKVSPLSSLFLIVNRSLTPPPRTDPSDWAPVRGVPERQRMTRSSTCPSFRTLLLAFQKISFDYSTVQWDCATHPPDLVLHEWATPRRGEPAPPVVRPATSEPTRSSLGGEGRIGDPHVHTHRHQHKDTHTQIPTHKVTHHRHTHTQIPT